MSERKQSKYAAKRASGRMMYGPGCCAHKVTDAQLAAGRERAREREKEERRRYIEKQLREELQAVS